jgi:hypothetical protein
MAAVCKIISAANLAYLGISYLGYWNVNIKVFPTTLGKGQLLVQYKPVKLFQNLCVVFLNYYDYKRIISGSIKCRVNLQNEFNKLQLHAIVKFSARAFDFKK